MTLQLETRETGVILSLKVNPKARQNALTGIHDGQLKISVTAPPEKGKANAAVLKLIATELGLKKGDLELIAGETSQQKKVLIKQTTSQFLSDLIHENLTQ